MTANDVSSRPAADIHPAAVPVDRLAEIAEAAAGTDATAGLLAGVEALTGEMVGHRLFSVSAYLPSEFALQRVYSNDETVYPVGGRKQKRGTDWARHVLQRGEAFLGQTAAIREAFDDHALIFRLGLGSIINVPVRWNGQTLGTMNLLDSEGSYGERHLRAAIALGQLLVPALMAGPPPR